MCELLLIADDLTGALDGAVAFVSAGVEVFPLAGQGPTVAELADGPRVVAVNAATRHMAPAQAAACVRELVERAREAGVRVILKKTDSALRGNVGAELAAAHGVFGGTLHFVPAYPELGRITVGGVHLVDGVPVGESSFGRDPFEPVRGSRVCGILAGQATTQTCEVLEGVQAPAGFSGIAVYDATRQDVIDAIARRLLGDGPVLLAGCAGLASAVARALGCSAMPVSASSAGAQAPAAPAVTAPANDVQASAATSLPKGHVLALCGSVNPASIAQCAFARAAGAPVWEVTEAQKKDAAWPASAQFAELASQTAKSWEATPLTVVDASAYTPAPDGAAPAPAVRDQVAANLGALACGIARAATASHPAAAPSPAPAADPAAPHLAAASATASPARPGYLFVMGGDVLLALVEAAGARTLRILGEVTTGVVASELMLDGHALNVISKSGGFGDKDLFTRVSACLTTEGPAATPGSGNGSAASAAPEAEGELLAC